MPKAKYLEVYMDVLARLNILPENPASDDGSTIYTLDESAEALTELAITPSDPAYNPLEVFTCILDAEAEAMNAFFLVSGQGRKGGEFGASTDPGFVVVLPVTKSGAVLPARMGKIIGVEVAEKIAGVEEAGIVWKVADPTAMSAVSEYKSRATMFDFASLGIFDPLYALNDDETRIWFTGEGCRVAFTHYQRRATPKTISELLESLKAECPVPEELVSAVKDIALGALMPREGEMTSAGAYFTNRGRTALGREQVKHQTKPPVAIGQKTDS